MNASRPREPPLPPAVWCTGSARTCCGGSSRSSGRCSSRRIRSRSSRAGSSSASSSSPCCWQSGTNSAACAGSIAARVLRLCAAGIPIAANWGVYIWGVNNGHVIETSLGYFINPLVTIGLGVVILHERLRAVQWAAVGLGVVAVAVFSFDYGRPPWIALALACSFGAYGFLKKGVRASPPEGLFVEGAVTSVPASIVLGTLALAGERDLRRARGKPGTSLPAHLRRPDHRGAAALLCRGRHPAPAVHDGPAPVRDPGHAVRHRRADSSREHVVCIALRVRARLDRARRSSASTAYATEARPLRRWPCRWSSAWIGLGEDRASDLSPSNDVIRPISARFWPIFTYLYRRFDKSAKFDKS